MSNVTLDYAYAAVANVFPGSSRATSLGNNPNIDTATAPEDVWAGAELGVLNGIDHRLIPRPQNVAVPMELVSSDTRDSAADVGARTVSVTYLDSLYVSHTVTLTLNGTTPVALPENVMRINALSVLTSGTFGGTNLGNLSIRATGGAGATFAYMKIGVGLARSSMFTVPANSTLDVLSLILSLNRTDTQDRWATFSLCFQTAAGRLLKGIELSASTTTPYRHEAQHAPITVVAAQTDVWWRCEAVSQNGTNTTGGVFGVVRPGAPYSGPKGAFAE